MLKDVQSSTQESESSSENKCMSNVYRLLITCPYSILMKYEMYRPYGCVYVVHTIPKGFT